MSDQAAAQHAALVDFAGDDLVGKDGPLAKVGYELTYLYQQAQVQQFRHPGTPFVTDNSSLVIVNQQVSLRVVVTGNPDNAKTDLAAMGMQITGSDASTIVGMMPISNLAQLAALNSVSFAAPNHMPSFSAGLVTTQGDAAMRADMARSAFNVDGTGVTVGVMSSSFNQIPYAGGVDATTRDIQTDDLPPLSRLKVLNDLPQVPTDEGRAMAQIVHDIAPGASIVYSTTSLDQLTFANNIRLVAANGANVIVDDVGYPDEPYFQNGPSAQAVNEVVAQGIAYFSSAGNSGDQSYESAFVDSGQAGPRGGKLHDFDPGANVVTQQQVTIPSGARIVLQWDQPFKSFGLGPGSSSDVDLHLFDSTGAEVASAIDTNTGNDPIEVLTFSNSTSSSTFFLSIELVSGPAPTLIKYIYDGLTINAFDTHSGTDVGHANTAGSVGVAASAYFLTPAFGTSPPVLNDFSSKGGVPILFDDAGNRLATPFNPNSPQVTGIDGTNTTFFGDDIAQDSDTFGNFFGTSAAAPHVAAVAALLLQATGGPGSTLPQTIYDALETTAIDITSRRDLSNGNTIPIDNGTGVDSYSGHGLVDVFQALQSIISGLSLGPDVALLEGDSGITDFVFTVTYVGIAATPVTVAYTTVDGTANSDSDYVPQSGTLTFTSDGTGTQLITIQVIGDQTAEQNETFLLVLSNPQNATLGRAQATGTILNDDIDLTINDVTVLEPDAGTVDAVFTVSSVGSVNETVFVNYAIVNISTNGGEDYLPRAGTVTLAPGVNSALIRIPVVGDTLNESTETFAVVLSNPSRGRIVKANGIATILDSDRIPNFYVGDTQVTKLPSGAEAAVFTIALDRASGQNVSVQYATSDGVAKDGVHYISTSGTVVVPAGATTATVTVPVISTAPHSADLTFFMNLSNPVHTLLADGQGVGRIILAATPALQYIVDDNDAGFAQSPGWTNVTNLLAYQLDYSSRPAGSGSGTATWTFNNIVPGNYEVFVDWVAFSNRATNAPYTIYDGATALATVPVNQRQAAVGPSFGNVTWQSLGAYASQTGKLVVRLGDNANGYVIADGVRIVNLDQTSPPVVEENPPVQSTSTHNAVLPQDVNGDNKVSSVDVLIVINNIHQQSASAVAASSFSGTNSAIAAATPSYFVDVNGDGIISPRDALMVINYLLQSSAAALAAPAAATTATDSGVAPTASPTSAADDLAATAVAVSSTLAPTTPSKPQAVDAALVAVSPAPTATASGVATSSVQLSPASVRAYFASQGKKSTSSDADETQEMLLEI